MVNPENGAVRNKLGPDGKNLPATAEVGGVTLEFPRGARIGPFTEWRAREYARRLRPSEESQFAGAHVLQLGDAAVIDIELNNARERVAGLEELKAKQEPVLAVVPEAPESAPVETSPTPSTEHPFDEHRRLTAQYDAWEGPRVTKEARVIKARLDELAKELGLG